MKMRGNSANETSSQVHKANRIRKREEYTLKYLRAVSWRKGEEERKKERRH
jgi:hypothetical protein